MNMHKNQVMAVVNENIEPSAIINALVSVCIGFGCEIEKELCSNNFIDANVPIHFDLLKSPSIILQTDSNKLRSLRKAALQAGIRCTVFPDNMSTESYAQQIKQIKQSKDDDLIYYGMILFGNADKVAKLTNKFSPWKLEDSLTI